MAYWNYAVMHVALCQSMRFYTKTKRTPYAMVMGHNSTDLYHVRQFGCRMLYHPVTSRPPPLELRFQEGVCQGHTSSSIYKVWAGKKVIRSKDVGTFEKEFPGTGGIRTKNKIMEQEASSGTDDQHSLSHTNASRSSDRQSNPVSDEDSNDDSGSEQQPQDALTIVPTQPSTYCQTDDEDENDVEDGKSGPQQTDADEDYKKTLDNSEDNDIQP